MLCVFASGLLAAAGADNTFEGTVAATSTRPGMDPVHFVFTRKGNQLRVENTSNKLEPINIVDFDAKRLTIVYPHNTTFVNVDLTKKQAQSSAPGLPPGMQLPPGFPAPGSNPAGIQQPGSSPPPVPGHIGPNHAAMPSPPPGFPSPPPMPSVPNMQLPATQMPVGASNTPPSRDPGSGAPTLPNQMPPMPAGVGPGPGAGMGMPMPPAPGFGAPGMPPMPPMAGMFGPTELKKTDKTKKIEGLDCTLYTVTSHGENFEIWATNDSALFPFRLIIRDYIGRRFGPEMLEETWPELVGNKSLFPLEATLKMDPGGQQRFSFKVDKIEKKKIDDTKLFQPPEKYIQIEAPQL
jgi:hypothetical protein